MHIKTKIAEIKVRQIFDSRGNPTIEVDLQLESGNWGRASAPSGASVGKYEILEQRDCDILYYNGKGVSNAISAIRYCIMPRVKSENIDCQKSLDEMLYGLIYENPEIGGNAILPISLAFARAVAASQNIELFQYIQNIVGDKYNCSTLPFNHHTDDYRNMILAHMPVPMLNVINGGRHVDNGLSVQEFMIVANGVEGGIEEQLRVASKVISSLKSILIKRGYSTLVGDEGGFAPNMNNIEEAIDLLREAIEQASSSGQIRIALDIAASELFHEGIYTFDGKRMTNIELSNFYQQLFIKYPEIISIEDPFADDDIYGWQLLRDFFSNNEHMVRAIVGDDLFVTQVKRLEWGVENRLANSILIKPNQVGTLSHTIETIKLAKKSGFKTIVSHRSGETEDNFISHLAIGVAADFIKAGSLCRGERVAKYNELLRIYENLHNLKDLHVICELL